MAKKELSDENIKLLYGFRDRLTKELWDMNKNEQVTKGQMIEFTYQKLTTFISVLDGKRIK